MQRILSGLSVLLVLMVGCASQGRPRVEGTVTLNGKPLGHRTLVLFADREDGEFFAQPFPLSPDGAFAGEVPEPGKYRIVIEESRAVQEGTRELAADLPPIPPRYRDRTTSDQSWTIHPGNNSRKLDLTD